jgi:hypothetical protein
VFSRNPAASLSSALNPQRSLTCIVLLFVRSMLTLVFMLRRRKPRARLRIPRLSAEMFAIVDVFRRIASREIAPFAHLRRLGWIALTGACGALVFGHYACVIAPTGDLPQLPEMPPRIIHASVVPSNSSVLADLPPKFVVPVELANPNITFQYAFFVDFVASGLAGNGLIGTVRSSAYELGSHTEGRTRKVEIEITADLRKDPRLAGDRCHRIEVVVALGLNEKTNARTAHAPPEPGGDVVGWFYNPNGGLGCPSLAVTDASVPADASGISQ